MIVNVKEIQKVSVESIKPGDCFVIEGHRDVYMRVRRSDDCDGVKTKCVNVNDGTIVDFPNKMKISVVHAVLEVRPLTMEEAEEWRNVYEDRV